MGYRYVRVGYLCIGVGTGWSLEWVDVEIAVSVVDTVEGWRGRSTNKDYADAKCAGEKYKLWERVVP